MRYLGQLQSKFSRNNKVAQICPSTLDDLVRTLELLAYALDKLEDK